MKKRNFKQLLSVILCVLLIAAIALSSFGCSKNDDGKTKNPQSVTMEGGVIGSGKTVFNFTVTDADGKDTVFEVHTDKTTVGDALLELGIIEGDPGDYGLYVKTVNGITADYDKDKTYWAFYVNGEYAMTGVDTTEITGGSTYAFKIEK